MESEDILMFIALVLFVLSIVSFAYAIIEGSRLKDICKTDCYDSGGIGYELEDDLCICYHSDKIRVWTNDEKFCDKNCAG